MKLDISYTPEIELGISGPDGRPMFARPIYMTPLDAMRGAELTLAMNTAREIADQAGDNPDIGRITELQKALILQATNLTPEEIDHLQMGQRRAIAEAIIKTSGQPAAEKKT